MADPRRLAKWAGRDEPIVWFAKPHPLFILLWRLGAVIGLLALAAGIWWALAAVGEGAGGGVLASWRLGVVLLLGVSAMGVVVWSALVWANQEFLLTPERAIWASGVVTRLIVQVPLERVQNVVVSRTLRERLFGLGTVGLATAGTATVEIVWPMVADPSGVVRRVTDAVSEAQRRRAMPADGRADAVDGSGGGGVRPPTPTTVRSPAPPVIGLAGGIGSGKSKVARIMEARGCTVLDSDAQARAALDLPRVREELVRWWGERVLGPDGRIDRRAVASIVFAELAERRRLEALVHPIVHASRREVIERARRDAASGDAPGPGGIRPPRALVVDAPLLFEAGVDRECDAVVFVDTPREVRLERVRSSRGWDEAELARRESAQLPLAEKRARSSYTVVNSGSVADLERQVDEVLQQIERGQRIGHGRDGA